ncbi:MAG: MFS transporter [Alphaproteobacteria bacterium]|nr:MFS transporter [Alphaproteobacteria bacterium]
MAEPDLNGPGTTDYDRIRRLPFLYGFSMLTGAAILTAVGAPFTLFLTELGFGSDRIGILGGMMPFFQVFGIAFLPLIMRFGSKRVATVAFTARYLFLMLFLAVPFFLPDLNTVFWILFAAMAAFSMARTIAEAAFVPWSQEIIPRSIRGSISGKLALFYLPVGLLVSYGVKLWLDAQMGIDRFYGVFVFAIVVGIFGALSLLGLAGGRPGAKHTRGMAAFRSLAAPLRDKNFALFLVSSGTQYLVFLVVDLFLILYFREKFFVPAGQLVVMGSLILIGGAMGSFAGGWLVDRHGSRGVRITTQIAQVIALVGVGLLPAGGGVTIEFLGAIFVVFGALFGASITAANVYLLNYVPSEVKESYLALAYSVDGIIGGSATFGAGFLIYWLQTNPTTMLGVPLGGYETLFMLCAVVIGISLITYGLLREEGATGVKEFVRQFYAGNPVGILWGVHRYGHQTSEERRLDLTHKFGGARSMLASEELFDALHDPSFDVRYEAIAALGHLPRSERVVTALENMLVYDGLVELQHGALTSLGRIGAKDSGPKIARFMGSKNVLLRARAIRTIGDIGATGYLPQIRQVLANDADVDCRLAAVSALGKMKDRESFAPLLGFYRTFNNSSEKISDEPRSKVILLALAKILNREGAFAQEWRREEKYPGRRLPGLIKHLAAINAEKNRRVKKQDKKQEKQAPATENEPGRAAAESVLKTLQGLRSGIVQSGHKDRELVLQLLDGTGEMGTPHRAFLVLLAVVMGPVLREKSR